MIIEDMRFDVQCIATKQYKGGWVDNETGVLNDHYRLVEKEIKSILKVIARRLEKNENYTKFTIIITPTFSADELRESVDIK